MVAVMPQAALPGQKVLIARQGGPPITGCSWYVRGEAPPGGGCGLPVPGLA